MPCLEYENGSNGMQSLIVFLVQNAGHIQLTICRISPLQIHHLVGHAHKVTCVRLFGSEHGVISGSADRSLKVWDISRQTYRQTNTLRHSSTSNCVDVGIDGFTAVSGHLDGGLRFWDIRTGERTADISRKFSLFDTLHNHTLQAKESSQYSF